MQFVTLLDLTVHKAIWTKIRLMASYNLIKSTPSTSNIELIPTAKVQ